MKKENTHAKSGLETDENQALGNLFLEKPHVYFNPDAQILDCNDAFLNIFKISKTDLLASPLPAYPLNNQFIEALHKAKEQGISTFRGNVLLGETTPPVFLEAVFLNIEPVSYLNQKIICLILESNINDSAIQHAYNSGNSISERTDYPDAYISIHALDGTALYISSSIETLLGYSALELKEMNPTDVVYPEDIQIIRNVVESLNGGIEHLNSRYRMVHKNGSVIPVESSSYLINDATGTGTHIVNVTRDLRSQAKMEHALERSEQKYYRLVMNLPTGISLITTKGQLLEVNEAMKNIMGLPLDAPIPEMNFFNIQAMQRMNVAAQLTKCIASKEIVNGEITFKISNKQRGKYLSYSFVPVLNSKKEVDVVIGYVSDLTQQMKAEIDSRERAEFLNLVINAIKAPFFVKDEDHRWVMLNNAAIEMMGQTRDALVGKSDYDLYPREQADIFWKYDELVFKTGSSSNEEQITWSDGKLHTIVTYKQLYIEQSTGNKFIVGTIHDISGYKKIEEDLRASEMKYHELFDNANDFIITVDLEGNITNANRTLLNYLKTDLEEISKHTVYDFISDDNMESAYALRDKILTGKFEEAFEINALGVNKQPVTYEVKASMIRQNGVLIGVQCVFSDVTKRKEATLKLEKYSQDLLELNKTKDKFFSIIAHDLRNPFSSMIGFSEMLLEDLDRLSKDEIRDSLKIIRSSAKNSFNLLDNLLAWSRLETGHMPFNPNQIVLYEAVEEVINILFSLAYRKKIEINNLVGPKILVYADKNMLETILNNLVMNAIKYTPTGGEINIFAGEIVSDAGSKPNFITISVADTGVGMDTNTLGMLFTLNKLVSYPGTEKEPGTGLGLLLTREMVEKHGGRIWAESTPGKGSVFSFQIPAFNPDFIHS
jgi:PAS domain S-box-containing protein